MHVELGIRMKCRIESLRLELSAEHASDICSFIDGTKSEDRIKQCCADYDDNALTELRKALGSCLYVAEGKNRK